MINRHLSEILTSIINKMPLVVWRIRNDQIASLQAGKTPQDLLRNVFDSLTPSENSLFFKIIDQVSHTFLPCLIKDIPAMCINSMNA